MGAYFSPQFTFIGVLQINEKSNFFIIVIFLICTGSLYAENLSIQAKNIEIKKDELKTIFKDKVLIVTDDGYKIESEYAEYNKSVGLITLRKSIKVTDKKENIIETEFAEYNEKNKELKSIGYTKISTVDGYILTGEDIFLNEITGLVKSINKATIIDDGKNKIF